MADANVDQVQLEKRSGISQKTISMYVRAVCLPTYNRMVRLAKGLGVSFFDLTMQRDSVVVRELSKMRRK